MNTQWKKIVLIGTVFFGAYFIPFEDSTVKASIMEAFHMIQYYAREHVLTCLIPAFFIAGAIATFISQGAVLKYFGAKAPKWLSYSVASVSGMILTICSCTVLPLFAGIYKRGAGLGPAIAFLYSGPAINILAIVLTARVLGFELGMARALGAVVFAVIIGLIMALLFKEEKASGDIPLGTGEKEERSPLQNGLYFLLMIVFLLLATMGAPQDDSPWLFLYTYRWYGALASLIAVIIISCRWFNRDERQTWLDSTWSFAQQIFPLLFAGVFIAGLLMGRPGSEAGLIPAEYIEALVGGNSLQANFVASILGAFMYFATLTEIPILEGLLGAGMGRGPALSLLLAGPALSLPNMLVIRSVIGTKKTAVFVLLVVIMATLAGFLFGNWF